MESDLGEKGLTFTMENKKLQNLTETENLAENVVAAAAEQKLENSQDPDAQTRKKAAELVNNAAVDWAAAAGNIGLSTVENAGVNGVTLVKLEQSGSDKFEEPVVQEPDTNGDKVQGSGDAFGYSDGFTLPVDIKVEAANELQEKIGWVGEMQNNTYVSDDAAEQMSNGEDHMVGVKFQESGNGIGDSDGLALTVRIKVEAANELQEKIVGVGEMQNSSYVSDGAVEQMSNGEDHMDGVQFQESGNGFGDSDGFTIPVDVKVEAANALKEKISGVGEMQNSTYVSDDALEQTSNGEDHMDGVQFQESGNGFGDSDGFTLPVDVKVEAVNALKEKTSGVGEMQNSTYVSDDAAEQTSNGEDHMDGVKFQESSNGLGVSDGFTLPVDTQGETVAARKEKISWFDEMQNSVPAEPQLAKNIGIKDGVLVPEARMDSHLSALMWPATSIALMKKIAVDVSAVNSLDLTVLKGRLSAFYRWKGIERLNICPEPLTIPGLEDKTVLKPKRGPSDDEDYYPQGGQLHPIRKRGLNELLNADSQNSKSDGDGVNLKFQKRMRIKVTNPISGAPRMRPREFIYVEKGKTETDEETPNKETEKPYLLSRERKRSKYLSPPYMDISDGLSYHRRKSLPESVMKADEAEVAEKERSESTKPGNKAALSMIRAAAVNPTEKNWPLDKVSGFASAFRSSVCIYESDKESYNKDRQASAADFNFIKEKLEKMSKMLEESETPNPSLLAEMKDLLGKVSGMAAKVE
ncbi:hypothetical protein ACFE04_007881 [Oxalis oulophora]